MGVITKLEEMVSLSEELKQAFDQFISGDISKDFLRGIVASVGDEDIDALIDAVDRLGDPSEYCEGDYDDIAVAGFFLYIDFISALVINLGESAIELTSKYGGSKHPFVPWIVKYTGDTRFHGDIMAKFNDIFCA